MIKLIRPQQWVKNTFIFLPMIFGGRALMSALDWYSSVIAFFAFSFTASAVYCLNDIMDVEDDRRHAEKCKRPLASGAITIPQAWGIMAVMLACAGVMLFLIPTGRYMASLVIIGYFFMNIAYCIKLKRYAILDVCIVAFGFVLRLLVGGLVTMTPLSKWIVLMTFLLTLFLSLAKRRDDVVRMESTGEAPRHNTSRYNYSWSLEVYTADGCG